MDKNFNINFIKELQELVAYSGSSTVKITIPKNFCGVEFSISEEEDIKIEITEHSGFNLDK